MKSTLTLNFLLFNFLFNFFVLRTLTDARAVPAGTKGRSSAKEVLFSRHETVKVKRSLKSILQSTCQDPGTPVNGHRVGVEQGRQQAFFPIGANVSFGFGAKVKFGCESSFLLRGSVVLSCERGSGGRLLWDSPAPQCVGKCSQFASEDFWL